MSDFATLMEQGVGALQQDDAKTARRKFKTALKKRTNDPDALHLLGLSEYKAG